MRSNTLADLTGDNALLGIVYDTAVNKQVFPLATSYIYQVNNRCVPVGDVWLLGAECGAKCYGKEKNKPIEQEDDYGALVGKGIHSIYGCDAAKDTQGNYRGFMRIQTPLQIEGLGLLPQLSI